MLVWGDIPSFAYNAAGVVLNDLKKVDPLTYSHCLRVGEYSRLLAKAAGLSEYLQKVAEFSGMLHDVGKTKISQEIIHKPSRLDEQEMAVMRDHAAHGEHMIKTYAHNEFFRQVIPVVRGHHERIDGTGYPDKLHGEDVPLLSRIILIVDTLDAMGQDRSYRKGLPIDVIYKELQKFAGTQFDANLVSVFLQSHRSWQQEQPDQETVEKIWTLKAG